MGLDMGLYDKNGDEVCSWRKANQIRAWLVNQGIIEYSDNCVDREVTTTQLKLLVDDCKEVLANHDKAEELLPTSSGSFFGSTEYDEWYFDNLRYTVEQLEPLLNTNEVYTYSDWW